MSTGTRPCLLQGIVKKTLFFRDFQFLADLQGVLVGEVVVVGEIVSGGAVTAGNGGERITPLDGVGGVAHLLLHRLDLMGICVSTGSACDSKETQISHVLRAIGLDESYAKGTIRVSFGKDNTVEDAEKIARSLI